MKALLFLFLFSAMVSQGAETNKVSTNKPGIKLSENQLLWTQLYVRHQNLTKQKARLEPLIKKMEDRNSLAGGKVTQAQKAELKRTRETNQQVWKNLREVESAMLAIEIKDPSAKRKDFKAVNKPRY